jgi:hypothetical protein
MRALDPEVKAIVAYGEVLVDDPDRYGTVSALGLGEVLFVPAGRFRRAEFSTQFCDVRTGQLLDRDRKIGKCPRESGSSRREALGATRSPSRPSTSLAPIVRCSRTSWPDATLAADPFHVVKVRHEAPCNRGRVRGPPLRAVAAAR